MPNGQGAHQLRQVPVPGEARRAAEGGDGPGERERETSVGWNCTNSRSWSGMPALAAMAPPSPVQVCAEVAENQARPYPPVARMVWWAWNLETYPEVRRVPRLPSCRTIHRGTRRTRSASRRSSRDGSPSGTNALARKRPGACPRVLRRRSSGCGRRKRWCGAARSGRLRPPGRSRRSRPPWPPGPPRRGSAPSVPLPPPPWPIEVATSCLRLSTKCRPILLTPGLPRVWAGSTVGGGSSRWT